MKLEGKVALVTGGSRGIGLAVASRFIREGARVALVARDASEVGEAVRELTEKQRGQAMGVAADVAKPEDVRRAVRATGETFGTVDILVNAAGVQGPIGRFLEAGLDRWTHTVAVNLFGAAYCIKEVLPSMVKRMRGKIITFSGGGATSPRPHFSAYAASKVALVRLTETLAEELRGVHVDVNAVAPGPVNTAMLREVLEAGMKAGEKELREARERNEKGGASPEAAADLCVFLASSESDGVTGKLISAQWDDWKAFAGRRDELIASSLYTLRRIDGRTFIEVKR